jgi:hypothetical protein
LYYNLFYFEESNWKAVASGSHLSDLLFITVCV